MSRLCLRATCCLLKPTLLTALLGKGKSGLSRRTPALLLLLPLSGVSNSCLLFCLLSLGMFSCGVEYCHFPAEIRKRTEERGKGSIHSIYGLLISVHLETQAYFFGSASSPQAFARSAHINVHWIVRILFCGVSVSFFSVSGGLGPVSNLHCPGPVVPHRDVCYCTFLSFQWSQKRTWRHAHIKLLSLPLLMRSFPIHHRSLLRLIVRNVKQLNWVNLTVTDSVIHFELLL